MCTIRMLNKRIGGGYLFHKYDVYGVDGHAARIVDGCMLVRLKMKPGYWGMGRHNTGYFRVPSRIEIKRDELELVCVDVPVPADFLHPCTFCSLSREFHRLLVAVIFLILVLWLVARA